MTDNTLRLAMDCGCYVPGDIDGNLSMIKRSIEKAIAEGCDVICFPEASLTGYSTKEIVTLGENSDILRDVTVLSERITIVIGAFENGPHIAQFIFKDGKLIGRYRKTHLGMNETMFIPGDDLPVFDIGQLKIGIQLCWEIHIPQITATYRRMGADLILNPTASGLAPERRMAQWRKVMPARADDNRLFYAACNSDGSSVLCNGPDGSEIDSRKIGDHLFMYVLDLSMIEKYRTPEETMRNIDYARHLRPELYDFE